jgi:hypothetical protein
MVIVSRSTMTSVAPEGARRTSRTATSQAVAVELEQPVRGSTPNVSTWCCTMVTNPVLEQHGLRLSVEPDV